MIKRIKLLFYKFQLWKVKNDYHELDMDMLYQIMTYEEYNNQIEKLSAKYKKIESKINDL